MKLYTSVRRARYTILFAIAVVFVFNPILPDRGERFCPRPDYRITGSDVIFEYNANLSPYYS